jgi:flagellar basal-body rod protein FlgC
MADDLFSSLKLSAAGMKAQGTRLRVISENIANADSLPTEPGKNPYRRKQITFKNAMNHELGMPVVKVDKIRAAQGEFQRRFEPSHPAADAQGYVLAPNVNSLVEMMDMREASRSYEANLSAIRTARTMMQGTIDILR